ncbi:NACHT domain-containing protein [Nocardia nepalensis]|uniref:NACHT domain-containing protein n=1 Tax=Nocardia nepalensis TaxID=3375448 RepID=UPI003B67327A
MATTLTAEPRSWLQNLLPGSTDTFTLDELERQFESVTGRLVNELELVHTNWPEPVGTDRFNDALAAVAEAIDKMAGTVDARTDLTKTPVSDVVHRIEKNLAESPSLLGADQSVLLLVEAAVTVCVHALLAWVTAIPIDSTDSAWATLAGTTRLIESTRDAFKAVRLEGLLARGPHRIAAIQRRDLLQSLKYMHLFGLPVEARYQTVPISVSHIEARFLGKQNERNDKRAPTVSLEKLLISPGRPPSATKTGFRFIITGKAGYGKTTAIQWIAYRASSKNLAIASDGSRQILPLFVHLRDATTTRYAPGDRALLYGAQLREDVPSDWLDNSRNDFTPLILLDGWDEISQEGIQGATAWVQSLAHRFPRAHIIITSRPEGMPTADLLNQLGFEELRIQPLRPPDAIALIQRWFRGLAEQLDGSEDLTLNEIDRAEKDLLHDLNSPTIRDMADTPLLTAMLCCLYATPTNRSPTRKGWLYAQVVSALLDRRERQRRIRASVWQTLDAGPKERLLGSIARAMAITQSTSIAISPGADPRALSIDQIVVEALPDVERSRAETAEWTKAVLDRSILLQRVSPYEAEFVHRSIQDYLVARTLRARGEIQLLLRLAAEGQWALLPFACYQADQPTADIIVAWLLEWVRTANVDADTDRQLRLLVVECVGAATVWLSDTVRLGADEVVRELFPPRDLTEVKTLTVLGNAAVPYLASKLTVGLSARRMAIETLCRIGSPEAMEQLTHYAQAGIAAEATAIGAGIERFNPPALYAELVLSRFTPGFNITARSDAVLAALRLAGRVNSLRIEGFPLSPQSIDSIRQIPHLRQLDIADCPYVGPLDWTTSMDSLKSISIRNSRGVFRLTAERDMLMPHQRRDSLGSPGLWALHLDSIDVGTVNWTTLLANKTSLRVLSLTNLQGDTTTIPESAVTALRNLKSVTISGSIRFQSLEFVRRAGNLCRLELGYALSRQDLANIAYCAPLRVAHLRIMPNVALQDDGSDRNALYVQDIEDTLAMVHELRLTGAPSELIALLGRFTQLHALQLADTRLEFEDTVTLPASLTELTFRNCTFGKVAEPIWSASNLQRVAWVGGSLEHLGRIPPSPWMRQLEIFDNGSLSTLSGLEWIPSNCKVVVGGLRNDLDQVPIKALADRCVLYFETDDASYSFNDGYWIDYGGV